VIFAVRAEKCLRTGGERSGRDGCELIRLRLLSGGRKAHKQEGKQRMFRERNDGQSHVDLPFCYFRWNEDQADGSKKTELDYKGSSKGPQNR
jgi:hypothetical protein